MSVQPGRWPRKALRDLSVEVLPGQEWEGSTELLKGRRLRIDAVGEDDRITCTVTASEGPLPASQRVIRRQSLLTCYRLASAPGDL